MNREEAIKVLNSRPYTGEVREALETLIPELNENTDERIRKWLIDYFKNVGNTWIHREISPEQILSYLEKQNHDGKKWITPAELNRLMTLRYEAGFDDGVRSEMKKQKEQKPAWSEEDVDMLNSCISSIEEAKENRYAYKETDGDTSYDHEIAWLKSLRPQQKVEWSEEDEKQIRQIERIVKNAGCSAQLQERIHNWFESIRPQSKIHYWTEEEIEPIISDYLTGKEHYGGMIARLRCLKPKSSWKPSEEELVALKRVGSILRDYGYGELAKTVFMIEGKLANLPVLNKSMWKPSEEQMKALEVAGKTFASFKELNMNTQRAWKIFHEPLESLGNDLVKLMKL